MLRPAPAMVTVFGTGWKLVHFPHPSPVLSPSRGWAESPIKAGGQGSYAPESQSHNGPLPLPSNQGGKP